jgi:hypothetical protein
MYLYKKLGSKNSKVIQKLHRNKKLQYLSLIAYHEEEKIRVKKIKVYSCNSERYWGTVSHLMPVPALGNRIASNARTGIGE